MKRGFSRYCQLCLRDAALDFLLSQPYSLIADFVAQRGTAEWVRSFGFDMNLLPLVGCGLMH